MRIGRVLTGLALVCAIAAPAAHADGTRTQSGPGTTSDDVFVTYVACAGFYGPAVPPQTRINLGPGVAPLGRRSLGLVPRAAGTASGPFARFSSLAGIDAGVSVTAAAGTTGASYVWVITPDVLPGTAWSGRAEVAVTPGAWQHVGAADLRYTWSLVDLRTRVPVADGGQATPREFAAAHGDGQGYVVNGFGCDGRSFNIDAAHGQGTQVDFEGITLSTTIEADPQVGPDGIVSVTGAARDGAGQATVDPLVLESRVPGGAWQPIGEPTLAGADGVTRVDVPITETTELRWHRPQSQYADEGWSDTVTVHVDATKGPQPQTEESQPRTEESQPRTEESQPQTAESQPQTEESQPQ